MAPAKIIPRGSAMGIAIAPDSVIIAAARIARPHGHNAVCCGLRKQLAPAENLPRIQAMQRFAL
jgi:hypothetical protein